MPGTLPLEPAFALPGAGDDGLQVRHGGHPGIPVGADDHVPLGVGRRQRHGDADALRRAEGEVDVGDAVPAGADLVLPLAGDRLAIGPPALQQVDHLLVRGGPGDVDAERRGDGERHVLARDGGGARHLGALDPAQIVVGHGDHLFRDGLLAQVLGHGRGGGRCPAGSFAEGQHEITARPRPRSSNAPSAGSISRSSSELAAAFPRGWSRRSPSGKSLQQRRLLAAWLARICCRASVVGLGPGSTVAASRMASSFSLWTSSMPSHPVCYDLVGRLALLDSGQGRRQVRCP